jgi:microcystin-dependent protein
VSDPYVGEIRLFGGNFAPRGWALCDGSSLPISEFDILFNLIGTTYGGDGQTTFNLPDLRGRVAIHQGGGHVIGEVGGAEAVQVTTAQMAGHSHPLAATTNIADQKFPANNILAQSTALILYIDQAESSDTRLNPGSLSQTGANRPHENRQPYQALNFIISLYGIYPPQG